MEAAARLQTLCSQTEPPSHGMTCQQCSVLGQHCLLPGRGRMGAGRGSELAKGANSFATAPQKVVADHFNCFKQGCLNGALATANSSSCPVVLLPCLPCFTPGQS